MNRKTRTFQFEILQLCLLIVFAGGHGFVLSSCSGPDGVDYALTEKEGFETIARMKTTRGEFAIRFFPEKAPNHVKNFVQLCGAGSYDGTYFHRVSPGFMIQGGDPNTRDDDSSNDGRGGHSYLGPGSALEAEFSDLPHRRGTVSMARSSHPDSAGSQFFILLADAPSLDGEYTVFGQVTEGLDVAAEIAEEPGTPVADLGGIAPAVHQYIEKCWLEDTRVEVGPKGNEAIPTKEPTTNPKGTSTAGAQ
jgi:peptidyl-prolyl cis-trans isomerase B (cyclophilin B)